VVAERVDKDIKRVIERFGEISKIGVKRVWEGQDPLPCTAIRDDLLTLTLSALDHLASRAT